MKLFSILLLLVALPVHAINGQQYLEAERLSQTFSHGYLSAARDYNGFLRVVNQDFKADAITFCAPQDAQIEQAAAIVRNYLRAKPEIWHYPANISIMRALSAAWPC